MLDLSVVIPLYNEEACIGTLCSRLSELRADLAGRGINHEILIIDDGSRDRSPSLLVEKLRGIGTARVLRHDTNRGFGAALKTGLRAASGRWIATVDADSNYDLREIPRLLDIARQKGVELVTGSPWHPEAMDSDFPVHRFLFSIGVAALYGWARTGYPKIHTYTCGFRVFKGERIREILPKADDFIATAEILVNAVEAGWTYHEVPWRVTDRAEGYSKLRTLRTIRGHLSHIGRIVLRRLAPAPAAARTEQKPAHGV